MKINIRGLVFTGFAAAVFAQSAVAVTPPSQLSSVPTGYEGTLNDYKAGLKKTVTSQDYTDENLQERVSDADTLTQSGSNSLQKAALIGWHYGDGGQNKEWVKLTGAKQVDQDTEYVEIVHKGADHNVQLNDEAYTKEGGSLTGAQMITAAGEGTSGQQPTALEKGRLTTAKAVYDFVQGEIADLSDDWQPKVDLQDSTKLRVGQWKEAVTDPNTNQTTPAHAGWATIQAYNDSEHIGDQNPATGYLTITAGTSRGVYDINLNNDMTVNSGSALNTAGTTTASNRKLATAKAVYDYSVPMDWTTREPSNYANKKLVTNASGVVVLADDDNSVLPPETDMPEECTSANGGHICALVAYYDANASGVGVGGVKYEWTVMAPTGL